VRASSSLRCSFVIDPHLRSANSLPIRAGKAGAIIPDPTQDRKKWGMNTDVILSDIGSGRMRGEASRKTTSRDTGLRLVKRQ
jgi:hypothetical protein